MTNPASLSPASDKIKATAPYILIPVYKGLKETQDCIESVIKYSSGYPLVVINDASPDPEISAYLESLRERGHDIHIFTNSANMGFVKTVNTGFQFDTKRDVIILNNDTVVTSNWVEKLRSWAYSDPHAATVTPMSNSATICSYPRTNYQNLLENGVTPDRLNSWFEQAGLYSEDEIIEIPTGIGFCMYIKRNYLNRVGYFNEELFGTGYGEENDFCMRCANWGGKHLVAHDTFIFHNEGVSFRKKQKQIQTGNAINVLNELYPDYNVTVQHHIETDPLIVTRRKVDLLKFMQNKKPGILFITHGRGGGVDKHVDELARMVAGENLRSFILTPLKNRGVSIKSGWDDEEFSLDIDARDWVKKLSRLLADIHVQHLHFHHLIDYPKDIYRLPELCGLAYDFTLHDFYMFCPKISGYMDKTGYYCGFDPDKDCTDCFTKTEVDFYNYYQKDVGLFREINMAFLQRAGKIISPSRSARDIYLRYFASLDIEVFLHPEEYEFTPDNGVSAGSAKEPVGENQKQEPILTIGLLGGLSPKKGKKILEECLALSRKKKLPIRWVLVGYTNDKDSLNTDDFIITGRYEKAHLPALFKQYGIQMVLIPALWPETYSYTLSESFALGCPVIVPAIGAFQERVEHNRSGIILPTPITAASVINTIEEIIRNPKQLASFSIPGIGPERANFESYFAKLYNHLTFKKTYIIKGSDSSDREETKNKTLRPEKMRFYERLIRQSEGRKLTGALRVTKEENRLAHNHVFNIENMNRASREHIGNLQAEIDRSAEENRLTRNHVTNIESENRSSKEHILMMQHQINELTMLTTSARGIAFNIKRWIKTKAASLIRRIWIN